MISAVEFLLEKYKSQNTLLFAEDFEQAKEMENQQIIEAYSAGVMAQYDLSIKTGNQYYNETFKKQQNDNRRNPRLI